jgi:O-antigen ligase
MLDMRLVGLFVSALALAAAARSVADPARLVRLLLFGTGVGMALAWLDLKTQGGLAQLVSVRDFSAPRLNQIAVWLTLLVLPAAAFLYRRWPIWLAAAVAIVMGATVFALVDTTAKLALGAGIIATGAGFIRLRLFSRLAAIFSVLAILAAPLVLPRMAHDPGLFSRIDNYKESAGHRLLIWSFVGDRIAEHPLRGWGLDTSRSIPGGSVDARPGEKYLPLHPHNSALQVWLELGAPGAVLFALVIAGLWWRLGDARWPRLYSAATFGSFTAALAVAAAGWGIWAEWWLGTLALAMFAILLMARAVSPQPPTG